MPTPAKPYLVLASEKKSHRTKEELKKRKEGEDALSTGEILKERPEVARNSVAHAEFEHINGLLEKIEKNDAIHETVINRYCTIVAECADLEEKRERMRDTARKIEEKLDELDREATFAELKAITSEINNMYAMMLGCDRQIQTKRKMLFDIEKENIMTIAAALRTIPKSSREKENPLKKALSDD